MLLLKIQHFKNGKLHNFFLEAHLTLKLNPARDCTQKTTDQFPCDYQHTVLFTPHTRIDFKRFKCENVNYN